MKKPQKIWLGYVQCLDPYEPRYNAEPLSLQADNVQHIHFASFMSVSSRSRVRRDYQRLRVS